jgi:hypothetical protein
MDDLPKLDGTTPRDLLRGVNIPEKLKPPPKVENVSEDKASDSFDTSETGAEKWNAFVNSLIGAVGKAMQTASDVAVAIKDAKGLIEWLAILAALALIVFGLIKAGIL